MEEKREKVVELILKKIEKNIDQQPLVFPHTS